MDDFISHLPVWGIFALAAIYVVVKLSYEFVERFTKRGGRDSSAPPSRNSMVSDDLVKAISSAKSPDTIRTILTEREDRIRQEEMHELLVKQDELIAQLARSDDQQSALLEELVAQAERTERMSGQIIGILKNQNKVLEHQAANLERAAAMQLDAARSWDSLRSAIERFVEVVAPDSAPPPALREADNRR